MANLKFKVGGVWNQIVTIKGDKGDAGDALPVGGTAGQLLIKQSSVDNDATWQNNPSAPAIHNHDDRYYTEDEMFDLLLGKANTLHGHGLEDIVGLTDEFATKAEKPTNETTATNGQILTANGDGTSTYKNLLMPKNWIINGMFDVWQRGTSIVNRINAETYNVDRYNVFLAGGTTSTTSQQAFTIGQVDVPNNPKYFSRNVVVSGGLASSRCMFQQKIEDVTKLSGKTITVSVWAKANANKNISIELTQDFGVGGSTPIVGISSQKFAIDTTWKRLTKTMVVPSVTSKTLGANNHLKLVVWFDAGSDFNARTDSLGNQSGTFDIANVSLVEGSVAVECQNQPYADVLRDCQRYGELLQVNMAGALFGSRYGGGALFDWWFDTPKRVAPTLRGNTISTSFGTGSNQCSIFNFDTSVVLTGTNVSLTFNNSFKNRVAINVNATSLSGTNGQSLAIDFASDVVIFADAEL